MDIKFGTSGWRGIISKDFTVSNLCLVIQAVADYIKRKKLSKKGLIVGYDTRFMSDRFAKISANILAQNKIRVKISDRDVPTPVLAFYIIQHKTAGAINITASHNPYEYNGVKFSTSYGGPASAEVTKIIEKNIPKAQVPEIHEHKIKTFNPEPGYIRHLQKIINFNEVRQSKLKIVIDCLHGTSRGYMDYLFTKTGVKTIVLNNDINPFFNGKGPDPSEDNLKILKDTVIKTKSHLGFATDGDADRFAVIDRDGTYIQPNQVLPLILDHVIKTRKHKGGVVRSITTTHMLDAIAQKNGRELYEVPVGFKYVGGTLFEKNALMGGEESGGMTIAGHVPEKDGILVCLLIAELTAYRKKSLKDIYRNLEKEYGSYYSKRVDIKITPEKKEQILSVYRKQQLSEFAGIPISEYIKMKNDNFKVTFKDGSWIIIRPSGTEPVIRCYTETRSKNQLDRFEKELNSLVA